MSRLAKKPVQLKSGVTAKTEGGFFVVQGPKGEHKLLVPDGVSAKIDGSAIVIEQTSGDNRALAGTTWSLIKNAIEGVADGFLKELEIEGVGYRVQVEGKELVLFLGYAQPVRLKIKEGVEVKVEKNTIKVSGIDKDLVGRVAADIRSLKRPEPYKGKGIHYKGEVIKRKVGKKAGATAAA